LERTSTVLKAKSRGKEVTELKHPKTRGGEGISILGKLWVDPGAHRGRNKVGW